MKKRELNFNTFLIISILIFISNFILFDFLFENFNFSLLVESKNFYGLQYFSFANGIHNSYFSWHNLNLYLLPIFVFSLTYLIQINSNKLPSKNIIINFTISIIISYFLFLLSFQEPIPTSIILLTPFTVISIRSFFNSILFIVPLFFYLILLSFLTLQYSIIVIFLSFIIHYALYEKEFKNYKIYLFIFLALTFSFFGFFNYPIPNFPDYQTFERFLPDDGILGEFQSSIFSSYHLFTINRLILKKYLFISTIILFIFSFITLFKVPNSRLRIIPPILIFSSSILLLSVYPNEAIAKFSPAFSLMRILPNYMYYPFEIILLYSSSFLLIIYLIFNKQFLICLLLILSMSFKPFNPELLEHIDKINSFNEKTILNEKHISPALSLYINHPNTTKDDKKIIFRKNRKIISNITSSHRSELRILNKMFDKLEHTRWHPKIESQKGSEWLQIEFKKLEHIKGIELDIGKFVHDYPRGIEIYNSSDCKTFNLIKNINPWTGNIKYTEKAFPFYGDQTDVKIYFDSEVKTKCLKIKQVGRSSRFDWSIAELKFGY